MNKLVISIGVIVSLSGMPGDAALFGQSRLDLLKETFSSFNQAFVAADIGQLTLLVTDNYTHTNQNHPPIDKTTWFDYIRKRRRKIADKILKIDTYDLSEVNYQLNENTAVITGVVQSTGTDADMPFTVKVRFTQTWVLINNEWKRAAFQDARL